MSANDNNPKVVDLNQRSAAATLGEKPAEALAQVRAHALKRLTGLATTLFENADDALFDLASKADNNAIQAQYFDGMREVRKKRQPIDAVSTLAAPRPRASETAPRALLSDFMLVAIDQ